MLDTAPLETAFTLLTSGSERLLGVVEAQRQHVERLVEEVGGIEREAEMLTFVSAALEQLLKSVSLESLETVEQLVTYGLRTVFVDDQLQFKIDVSTKFKQQWMEPRLIDGPVEAPVLDAFGGGPASVIAFLLRVLVIRRLGLAPVVLLDEPFSMVSSGYVELVAKLLRELAEKIGFTFIMVTHDREFLSYAHRGYEAVETSTGTIFKPVAAPQA